MKIVYLHQYFNTLADYGSTRSFEMARRLVEYGHEVSMITSYREEHSSSSGGWFESNEAGIKVYWLPLPYANQMSYSERIRTFVKFAWGAAIKAASIEADLVFATSTPLTIALPAVYSARKLKVPMVFEVRDLWPELPIAVGAIKNPLLIWLAKRLELFAYRNASRIIALSPGMKAGIISSGYPEKKVEIIPNGCDIDFFKANDNNVGNIRQAYEWLKDRPLILYAGTIGMINGLEYFALLADETKKVAPDVRFAVIGEGGGVGALISKAERLGVLNENLFILPKMAKADMPKWFAASDIVVSLFIDLKEMWNNSANKFFDGLAAGKPVAINYGGWQAELLKASGAGLILETHEFEQSAKLILGKIYDKEWLKTAGEAAKKLAVEKFDRNKLAKQLENTLIKAVSNGL